MRDGCSQPFYWHTRKHTFAKVRAQLSPNTVHIKINTPSSPPRLSLFFGGRERVGDTCKFYFIIIVIARFLPFLSILFPYSLYYIRTYFEGGVAGWERPDWSARRPLAHWSSTPRAESGREKRPSLEGGREKDEESRGGGDNIAKRHMCGG